MAGLIELTMIAGSFLFLGTWLFVAFFGRFLTDKGPISPMRRAIHARLWLYAPLWVPSVLLAGTLLSDVVGRFFSLGDHCFVHTGHWHHLCLSHPPPLAEQSAIHLLPLVIASSGILFLMGWMRRAWVESKATKTLISLSHPSEMGHGIRLVEDEGPLALTLGWYRNTILLSTGLLERLSGRSLAAVIAHEEAHVKRGDTRIALFDRMMASLLPQKVAAQLMGDLTLAREQACDQMAAKEMGNPLWVAKALTDVARLGMAVPQVGLSINSSALEARVLYLLEPPQKDVVWLLRPIAFLCVLIAIGLWPGHILVENGLELFLH